jgi:hypothetical protein
MQKFTKITLSTCVGLAFGISQALAGPKPDEIHRLSEDLTPMGSERAGNAEGTIPEWTGGITTPPAGYSPGDHHPDPFADDKPLFRITGANYQEYADTLSVGQKAVFERYPDTYFMDVYPSRRSASFPQRSLDMTIENGKTAILAPEGEGVLNAAEGFPFPFPENAYEIMWNHKLKPKGTGGVRYNNQVAPTANGSYSMVTIREELLGLYYKSTTSCCISSRRSKARHVWQAISCWCTKPSTRLSNNARHGFTIPASVVYGGRQMSPMTTPAPHPTVCAPMT